MKKIITLLTVCSLALSAMAQLAIPGGVFDSNPARFNGRKVTLKNVEIIKTQEAGRHTIGGPSIAAHGLPAVSSVAPCRAPRGFATVEVNFLEETSFKACFFMAKNMRDQMYLEVDDQPCAAQITIRGNIGVGYHISFYRIGY
jgi:hypothetical protein